MAWRLAWALVLTLVARASAHADDACLTGDSTLGDQRGIATLRAGLDDACPCATAASHAGFRHCAKGVLATALGDGTIRSACAKTAKRTIKTAACGTHRVACGRVQADADPVVSCKVRGRASCVDRARFDQTPCADEGYCADVVDWTAGTCSDARARGPYEAGARVFALDKPSAVDPTQTRTLTVVVWYPIAAGSTPLDSTYEAVRDAPLDASGGPYPVVMFSHGSCGVPTQSVFLHPLLASRGYVVVAPSHPGNTFLDGPSCTAPQTLLTSAIERPQDVRFTLDHMLAESADPASPFFGALDATRIAMTGHSFGGFTTYVSATQDARYKVAVPLAPAVPGSHPMLTIPSLTMISELDTYVNNDQVRGQYAIAASPKWLVEIAHAGHFAYSNACFPSPDCQPPATLTQEEANTTVVRWVVPFLEWYLKGDARFAAFFATPQPVGVTVQSQ
jgi:dienelactone hydrolase